MSGISIEKLRPHPSNNLYFDDLSGDDWESFLNDVRENGIRDPLRITTDFQVICGHQRLRAAKELGLTTVPVIIEDIQDVEDVERLLVEDNLHRRHLTAIQKAKLAATLKERWGIKRGGNQKTNGQNVRSIKDIAEAIGESEKTTQRLIKLNDLIPELKKLVESKKLGTTFAEKLASLTVEEQTQLYHAFGDEIGKTAKEEAERIMREAVEYEKAQIEKKYRDSIPRDAIPDIQAAAVERHQEETAQFIKQKEKETESRLKQRDEYWKNKLRDDLESERLKAEQLKSGYQRVKEELESLKLQQPADFDEQMAEAQMKKLRFEADSNTIQISIHTKQFLQKVGITSFMLGAIASASSSEKKRLNESLDMLQALIDQLRPAINARKVVEKNVIS
ncbi:ParB/RepB/Spo0J family partition protein [Paenibacillus oleatilyticus]|uniref:ParB/RepB/Spo0J family partition protein n=1 Tax=Paenibacillus oleatilyticus TaxID=2594886 RepID=UPI001C2012C7|nr:ParB N-terminal domain-containing protein [Paenibacillus oleatilyticus]MBU7320309.1 ParB N-terminal domain-containing protein [Paenibacillus oleatilyticus]